MVISVPVLWNPLANGGGPGGEGEREEEDNDDGPSDIEGGEEDGMSYSRLRKQQVSMSCQCEHAYCSIPCTVAVHFALCTM